MIDPTNKDPLQMEVLNLLNELATVNEFFQNEKSSGDEYRITEAVITQKFLRDHLKLLHSKFPNMEIRI